MSISNKIYAARKLDHGGGEDFPIGRSSFRLGTELIALARGSFLPA